MAIKGNMIIAQSGGPTTVINASIQGAIEEAMKHSEIGEIYAAYNSILGVIKEEIFDLRKEDINDIKLLSQTPAAALGSSRYKIKKEEEIRKIFEVFKKYNIRYFFYAGGNDSMDTADKVNKLAEKEGYEIRVMGIPKTVDNDLAETDHTPGYGSVIKYLATMTMEAGKDTEAMHTIDRVNIIEAMGRNAGWIAAGAALAKREDEDAPHIILLPEIPFDKEKFLAKVSNTVEKFNRAIVVVSEGTKNPDGSYIAEQKGELNVDSFGHKQLGGAALFIKNLIESELKLKSRFAIPSTIQRAGMHFASKTDIEEAYLAGKKAVEYALSGKSGYMVVFKRVSDNPYKIETDIAKLSDVANGEKKLPADYISEDGFFVTDKFIRYATPLIQGEAAITIKNGLPYYVRLKKFFIKK